MPLWLRRNKKIRARDGLDIWINKNRWYEHICDRHPEMKPCLEDVITTLKNPEAIYYGNNTFFAYSFSEKRGKFIMVLYHKSNGRQGYLKTAYQTSFPDTIVSGKIRVYPNEGTKKWVQRAFSN